MKKIILNTLKSVISISVTHVKRYASNLAKENLLMIYWWVNNQYFLTLPLPTFTSNTDFESKAVWVRMSANCMIYLILTIVDGSCWASPTKFKSWCDFALSVYFMWPVVYYTMVKWLLIYSHQLSQGWDCLISSILFTQLKQQLRVFYTTNPLHLWELRERRFS